MKYFILIAFAIVVSCATVAQNQFEKNKTINDIEQALQKCYDRATDNANTITCAYDASKAANNLLNQLYKKALAIAPTSFKNVLITSQRQWLTYKINDDRLQEKLYAASPGTMYIPMIGHRSFELIKERCIFLEEVIERF